MVMVSSLGLSIDFKPGKFNGVFLVNFGGVNFRQTVEIFLFSQNHIVTNSKIDL